MQMNHNSLENGKLLNKKADILEKICFNSYYESQQSFFDSFEKDADGNIILF
jgi:hypothetical protein